MDPKLRSQLQATFRSNVFDILRIIASKDEQLEWQKNVPYAAVSDELFCHWESDYQDVQGQMWFIDAFTAEELKLLHSFDECLESVATRTPQTLPFNEDFVLTSEWRELNSAAARTLARLKDC